MSAAEFTSPGSTAPLPGRGGRGPPRPHGRRGRGDPEQIADYRIRAQSTVAVELAFEDFRVKVVVVLAET
jgi:hypothetical protein